MYEGILVDVVFTGFFLAKVNMLTRRSRFTHYLQWPGKQKNFLDDPAPLDPDL
jgi:hypothetical protein